MSKKLSTEDLQKRHADLLGKHGSILCTDDGQAFYNTPQGKSFAESHASTIKSQVTEIKAPKAAKKKDSKDTKK